MEARFINYVKGECLWEQTRRKYGRVLPIYHELCTRGEKETIRSLFLRYTENEKRKKKEFNKTSVL